MLNTKKRASYIIMVAIITIAMVLGMFAQIPQVHAAEVVMGSVNYEGRDNYCRYNIKFMSNTVLNNYVFAKEDFGISLEGKECKRNIFTTFTYDITFQLYKESVLDTGYYASSGDPIPIKFKITNKNQVNGQNGTWYILFIRHSFAEAGNYRLTWFGSIASNTTVTFSEATSYIDFQII